jgi:transcriptional regulator with XRE-family HTH domain
MKFTLREIRRGKGKSLLDMARLLGFKSTKPYVEREINPGLLTITQAKMIADYLRVDVESISDIYGIPIDSTRPERQVSK